ncbi:hypothetical protein ACIF6K_03380 [Streptomyces sp. NPDC085942]|uniref:hypothetical protein n=1 Tax=unclassified Streptomyces TaxID=2593676 RepID=UPI0037D918CB|nr:hypothetical protein OG543_21205 [Streptomyces sp. NBC_01178]
MTTPPHPPHPPQGPYGPQNPQHPYGPPAAAPGPVPHQQPYGYPQPPPAPPLQGAWGEPDPRDAGGRPSRGTRPPRGKRVGLIVGIALGAMVVAGGIVFGVARFADRGSEIVYPKAEYRLVVQKQLLDGEFTLGDDLSETEGKEIEETPDLSVRDAEAVVAHYTSADGGALILSGMYGRLASPDLMRGTIMEGAAGAEGGKVVVPPEEFRPRGYGIVVECQVVQSDQLGTLTNVPMCAWADGNTAALVALVRTRDVGKDAKAIDLAAAAEETARVRKEAREPLG